MKTQTLNVNSQAKKNDINISDFYNNATADYEFWSRDFNMHFGYFKPFKTNPFKRDTMLNEMNAQIMARLKVDQKKHRLIDLGCGMGGTMRYALKHYKKLIAYGVTLSDFQLKKGNELLNGKNGIIVKENYNDTSFQDNTFDSAIAIESFCHSGHSIESLKEAHRILKSGGRLVIADAFLKKEPSELCKGSKLAYHNLCDHWSLKKLETPQKMKQHLQKIGFTRINIENISMRVAPSVLHVPFAISGFIIKNLFAHKTLKGESLHNLKGSFFALICGLHLKSFGYHIITADKM